MPWNEPSFPDIEAVCDKCGATEYIEPWNTPSGHWMYPQPGERGACGWDWGEEGVLCPNCQGKAEPTAYESGVISFTVPTKDPTG
jgi:hypothetical protein